MRENQVGEWKKKIKVIGARLAAIGLHASLISGGTTRNTLKATLESQPTERRRTCRSKAIDTVQSIF